MPTEDPLRVQVYSLDIEHLLESAFQAGSLAAEREQVSRLKPIVKARIKEKTRLRTASQHILRSIGKLERSLPPASRITPFYRELLSSLGASRLAECRREVARSARRMRFITRRAMDELNRARSPSTLHSIRRAAYGRISSELRSLSPTVAYLAEIAPRLKELPTIKPDLFTVVIAGYPNVGKTTLLKALTGSAPEIQPVPFTTQKIQIGYYDQGWETIQVIDTPGLLDRPLAERNPVEMKAIAALDHLSSLVIFLIDPTTLGGFPLEDQVNLLEQVRTSFTSPIIVVVNKIDIASEEQLDSAKKKLEAEPSILEISSVEGKGLQSLREEISSYLIESGAHVEG